MKHTISSIFNLTQSSTIVCPITGISIECNIPTMGIDFTMYSPFVKFSNIEKLLELPSPKMKELPTSVLSGILLAVFHHYSLSERHEIEAWEANIYIQNCSKHEIISAIRFLCNISESGRNLLPSLSLHSFKETVQHSSSSNIINTYIKTCRDIINPPASEVVSSPSSLPTTIEKKEKAKKVTPSERERMKELISEVSMDVLATQKLIQYLRILAQKENIYTAAQETKEKVIARLESMASPESLELASIIKKATPSIQMQEDLDLSRVSDTFAIVTTRKSLSEILAAKIASQQKEGE